MANEATSLPRWLPVLVLVGIALTILVLAVVGLSVISVLNQARRMPIHVCAVATIQRSKLAERIAGTPLQERSLETFSSTSAKGADTTHESFKLHGPKADISALADATQTRAGSHLTVGIVTNGRVQTIYSGPLDCPELRATP
jgi:hypothetical protein